MSFFSSKHKAVAINLAGLIVGVTWILKDEPSHDHSSLVPQAKIFSNDDQVVWNRAIAPRSSQEGLGQQEYSRNSLDVDTTWLLCYFYPYRYESLHRRSF